jgi:hypothetical protein
MLFLNVIKEIRQGDAEVGKGKWARSNKILKPINPSVSPI